MWIAGETARGQGSGWTPPALAPHRGWIGINPTNTKFPITWISVIDFFYQ